MRQVLKRGLALLLAVMMVFGIIVMGEVSDSTFDNLFVINASAYENTYPTEQWWNGKKQLPCTWVAKQEAYERLGIEIPNYLGNGCYWFENLKARGYCYGSTPRANSIACYNGTGSNEWGHVAYVTSVNADGSFNGVEGGLQNYRTTYSNRNATIGSVLWGLDVLEGFIYLNRQPNGYVDELSGGLGTIKVRGWAYDPDEPGKSIGIHIYVGGPAGSSGAECIDLGSANVYRPDVNNAFGCGNYHGYDKTVTTSKTGTQTVYVYALDSRYNDNPMIGSKTITISSDNTKPTVLLTSTNSAAASQTATLKLNDNMNLAGYYWGTNASYTNNAYTAVSGTSKTVTKTITSAGTYYLTAKDAAGNISSTDSETFYKTTLNANGGSVSPASVLTPSGCCFKLPTPSRTGYTFKNWNTSANGSGSSYNAGAIYPAKPNVTLYAQWTPITYPVQYNANGGSNPPTAQTKNYGQTLTLSAAQPNRTGYNFTGWNTAANGTGTAYAPGGAYTANAAATLYAQWTGVDCTATFHANAGSFDEDAVTSKIVPFGSAITADGISEPTRQYHDFVGWSRRPGATAAEALGKMDSLAGVPIYAVWQPTVYTISYNAQSGTGAPEAQTKTYDTDLTLRTEVPIRADYIFLGWATTAGAQAPEYQPGDTYTGAGDQTLYAVWAAAHYTISYNANGGTNAPESIVKDYGADVTLTDQIPVRSGYTFLGWAERSAFPDAIGLFSNGKTEMSTIYTEPAYQPGDVYSADKSVTLYAVWEGDCFVNYDPVNGTGEPPTQTFATGESLKLSEAVPTREFAVFDGWATSAGATEPTYQPGDLYTGSGTITLYAVWTEYESDQFVIYFDARGGTVDPPYIICNKAGEPPRLPEQVPQKRGYAFKGWKTSKLTAMMPSVGETYYPGDRYDRRSTKTLYAAWASFSDTSHFRVEIITQNADGTYSYKTERFDYLRDNTATITYDAAAGALLLRTSERGNPLYASYELPAGTHLNEASSILSDAHDLRVVIERNRHMLRYCNEDGSPIRGGELLSGMRIGEFAPGARSGYTFLGWSEDHVTVFDTSQPMPDRDLTLYAMWQRNEYAVTFRFGNVNDGEVFFSNRQVAGTPLLVPEIPTVEGHTFSSWNLSVPSVMPAQDLEFVAYYVPNYHMLTYLLNGSEYSSGPVAYGTEVDTEPFAEVGYTWTDWEFTPPLENGRMPDYDVVATATSTINSHTVTWQFDGNTYEESFEYGAPIRDFAPPEMEGCTFVGWTPAVPDAMPDEDVELIAVYTPNTYKVKWKVNGISFSQNYTYGDPITPIADPEMDDYLFVDWDSTVPETMPGHDLEFNAVWMHIHDVFIAVDSCEPTCTSNGYTGDLYCSTCGARVDFGDEIPATGHSFESVETYENGKHIVTLTCTRCGYSTHSGDNGRRVITLQQVLETIFNRVFGVLFRFLDAPKKK